LLPFSGNTDWGPYSKSLEILGLNMNSHHLNLSEIVVSMDEQTAGESLGIYTVRM